MQYKSRDFLIMNPIKCLVFTFAMGIAFYSPLNAAAKSNNGREFLSIKRTLKERLAPLRKLEKNNNVKNVDKELDACYELTKKKDYEQALAKTEEFLLKYSKHPLYPEALYLKAEILLKKNPRVKNDDIDTIYDIIDAFKKAIDSNPNAISAEGGILSIAKLYRLLELPTDAISYYKEAIKKYPNSPRINETFFALGNMYYEKKDYKKCIDIFYPFYKDEKGTRIGTEAIFNIGLCYYGMKNYELAAEFFLDGAHEDFSVIIKKPKQRMKVGEALFQVKNFKKSLQVFTNLREDYYAYKDMDIILLRIGDCHNQTNKYVDALEQYIEVISDYPFSRGALSAKIRMAELKEKERAIKLNLDYPEMIYYNDPEKTYKKIIDEYSGAEVEETAINGLAMFYLNRQRYAEAIENFIRLLDRFPNGIITKTSRKKLDKAMYSFIKELYGKQKYKKILDEFSKKKQFLSSGFSDNFNYFLGMSNYKLYLHKAGEKHLLSFLRRGGSSEEVSSAKKTMVDIYFKTKRTKKALKKLNNMAKSTSLGMWANAVLANYYFELKNYKNANRYFSRIYNKKRRFYESDMKNIFRYITSLQKQRKQKKMDGVFSRVMISEYAKSGKDVWFVAILSKYGNVLYNKKAFTTASKIFQKASELALNKSDKLSSLYQKALCYIEMKKYLQGKNILKSMVKDDAEYFWQKQALFKLENLPEMQ